MRRRARRNYVQVACLHSARAGACKDKQLSTVSVANRSARVKFTMIKSANRRLPGSSELVAASAWRQTERPFPTNDSGESFTDRIVSVVVQLQHFRILGWRSAFSRCGFTFIARVTFVWMSLWLSIYAFQTVAGSSIAYELTGLSQVQTKYGLSGVGQTVVVIDTGVAFDHAALGGAFGPSHRVVGGWDFAEDEVDPYDDGPAGSHGTHVAGIVGAADNEPDTGVVPGVDLVSLRVFNDSGDGSFERIKDALHWVHVNRDTFENPITAVNLSLGASWNSDVPPPWATLEPELAQLEADGLFISVAAGNEFAEESVPGLGYPAASPHVVPVMSFDDDGQLSYFSQRHSRAIAAPGRKIVSTIPDYAGNNNGISDDYVQRSGTNMAAPFIAGASVLIREAMEMVGYTNITQQTLYEHMMVTADSIYDSTTDQQYYRINLLSAIESLLGLSGDFNGDGVVSAADFSVWRDTLGSTVDMRADADRNGAVDEADYEIWKVGFSGMQATTAVSLFAPEPISVALVATALAPILGLRSRFRES